MRVPDFHLRLTDRQHRALKQHLFPGDGLEAVALVLCGRRESSENHVLVGREILCVPYAECHRHEDRVTWPLTRAEQLLTRQYGRRQAIVKVHSHPASYKQFSELDDISDRKVLAGFSSFCDDGLFHGSAVMLPDGSMFGRVLLEKDSTFKPLTKITVVGDDIVVWPERKRGFASEFTLRQAQAFGEGTVDLLRSLTVGVVGCSGTGSFVVEQLARLGFHKLVLIDPDKVEEKNLNRIVNASKEDAYLGRSKVRVLASAIARMGLGQEVVPLQVNIVTREAVLSLAECDIVFGCMDGVEGRNLLNRLSTFYLIPYFDVGVKLEADGKGGIKTISGAVHYLQPGKSSLYSRGMYDMEQVRAESTRRISPERYEEQRRQGYIRGVAVDRPAVVSVNAFFAAVAVNDMLARLHPYRNLSNGDFATIAGNLAEVQFFNEPENNPCQLLLKYVGVGDIDPLLDRSSLS
jgi:hypothetical protein